MTIRAMEGEVDDLIPVKNVLISVFSKSGLEQLVPVLLAANPDVRFMSTGGTYTRMREMLGSDAPEHLMEVAEYTEFPEMDGGLVKTLHPKIHAGLLGERNNPKHQKYLRNLGKTVEFLEGDDGEPVPKRVFDAEVGKEYKVRIAEAFHGVFIDMVVVNLYPFEEVVRKIEAGEIDPKTKKPYNFESARGNIDIGGPAMIRAGAKNFTSCAAVCDPADYAAVIKNIEANQGCTTQEQRLKLKLKVFETTAHYDANVAAYLAGKVGNPAAVRACYNFVGGD